jgi:hypothetical protein
MRSEEIKATGLPGSADGQKIPETQAMLEKQAQEVETLVQELRKLLVRYESALGEEGVRGQLETLERWSESFRRGLKAAAKMSALAPQWLRDAQEKLKLAADELNRMDAESPCAPNAAPQDKKAEDYIKATRRIDALIPAMDHVLIPAAQAENDNANKEEGNHAA